MAMVAESMSGRVARLVISGESKPVSTRAEVLLQMAEGSDLADSVVLSLKNYIAVQREAEVLALRLAAAQKESRALWQLVVDASNQAGQIDIVEEVRRREEAPAGGAEEVTPERVPTRASTDDHGQARTESAAVEDAGEVDLLAADLGLVSEMELVGMVWPGFGRVRATHGEFVRRRHVVTLSVAQRDGIDEARVLVAAAVGAVLDVRVLRCAGDASEFHDWLKSVEGMDGLEAWNKEWVPMLRKMARDLGIKAAEDFVDAARLAVSGLVYGWDCGRRAFPGAFWEAIPAGALWSVAWARAEGWRLYNQESGNLVDLQDEMVDEVWKAIGRIMRERCGPKPKLGELVFNDLVRVRVVETKSHAVEVICGDAVMMWDFASGDGKSPLAAACAVTWLCRRGGVASFGLDDLSSGMLGEARKAAGGGVSGAWVAKQLPSEAKGLLGSDGKKEKKPRKKAAV
jgi:hypothetical protein